MYSAKPDGETVSAGLQFRKHHCSVQIHELSKRQKIVDTINLTTRLARLDEAALLTDIAMRSKQSNGYDDAFMAACREELTVTRERMAGLEYWVAEERAVYGYVCLGTHENSMKGEVHAFFIDPAFQRKGVGTVLWHKVLERARDKKLVELWLDADPFAAPFYEKLGFETMSQTPSGSIPGRTLPRMRFKVR